MGTTLDKGSDADEYIYFSADDAILATFPCALKFSCNKLIFEITAGRDQRRGVESAINASSSVGDLCSANDASAENGNVLCKSSAGSL